MRKIFEVIIHDKPFDCWDIDGKEHQGLNGEPKTWWLYYSERLPEGVNPPLDSEHWKPWHSWINRRPWDIKFVQKNTTKVKWDELNFRNHTSVEMWCNQRLVYSFGTTGSDSGLAYAFGKVQYLMVALSGHPFNFFEPEKENGRKIFWKGLPAFVVSRKDSNEIRIRPDYDVMEKKEWWAALRSREELIGKEKFPDDFPDDSERAEDERNDLINWGDAFSDGNINWFRK